jgi:hypothetical protein
MAVTNPDYTGPVTGRPNDLTAEQKQDLARRFAVQFAKAGLPGFEPTEAELAAPLHEELAPYVVERPIGQMLQHPLVNVMYHEETPGQTANVNEAFRRKRQLFEQAITDQRYDVAFLALVERPWRLEMWVDAYRRGNVSTDDYLHLLAAIWADAEPNDTLPKHLRMWKHAKALNGGRTVIDPDQEVDPPAWLNTNEWVAVYRGMESPTEARGVAWSTDRSIAAFFAQRYAPAGEKGLIVEGRVRASNVLAWIQSRNESEVVVDPARVRSTSVKEAE